MNATNATGTTYDGGTPLLRARTPVSPGAHSLFLSIFDQGDHILDSAVFLDNLSLSTVPPSICTPGAQPLGNVAAVNDFAKVFFDNYEALNLNGLAGNDVVAVSPTDFSAVLTAVSLDGGAGANDQVQVNGSFSGETMTLLASSVTTTNEPTVNFTGMESASLSGNSGNDIMLTSGSVIPVTLNGGVGDDSLNADGDLLGGTGNDTMIGGAGNNVFTGGAGNDLYLFNTDTAQGSDTITELTNEGNDTLNFSGSTINSIVVDLGSTLAQGMTNLTLTFTNPEVENVIGGSLNDSLTGNALDNRIEGGAGNDTLNGLTGNDTYVFNASNDLGSDVINDPVGSGSADALDFSATSSAVTVDVNLLTGNVVTAPSNLTLNVANAEIEIVTGGSGNDTLIGNATANTLQGGPGNDSLAGNAGNDTYLFNADNGLGTDTVTEAAGGGTDVLDFSASTVGVRFDLGIVTQQTVANNFRLVVPGNVENLTGGAGADTLSGDSNSNTILGNGGGDLLGGGAGADSVDGGAGNDVLIGSFLVGIAVVGVDGNDTLIGGAGDDLLLDAVDPVLRPAEGAGDDSLSGGEGNDTLGGGFGNDTLDGGNGTDRLYEAGNTDFTLTNAALTGGGGLGTDILTSLEEARLTAGIGNNNLNASAFTGNVTLEGNAGLDTLIGGSGNDSLAGGFGNDSLTGNLGNDTMDGGDNLDSLVETGDFSFTLFTGALQGIGVDILANIETAVITGGSGGNVLDAARFTGRVTLFGAGGNDTLRGSLGDDLLDGGTGTNTVDYQFAPLGVKVRLLDKVNTGFQQLGKAGGNGKDSLLDIQNIMGSLFDDNLFGNALTNAIQGLAGIDHIHSGKGGNDTLDGGEGDDVLRALLGSVSLLGGAGNDKLISGVGNDILDGGAGSDTLIAGTGADSLIGGSENDFLFGDAGNDTLRGDAGSDDLHGGLGYDLLFRDSVDRDVNLGGSGPDGGLIL